MGYKGPTPGIPCQDDVLHLIYRCFDTYILCLTCVGIFIAYRGLGQISEMMLGYSLTLENICDRWSGRINVLVEKASEEADLWPSATWYAKSLTIGFEASLHKKLHKCPADVSLTCWWHSVYGWYLQFHETSTPRSGPDRGQIKFRLTATSHLPPRERTLVQQNGGEALPLLSPLILRCSCGCGRAVL